ncbi:hypothetical protein [Lactobacillus brevis] [Lactiplantibacillus mudanjiangensis]|uniref:DUF3850 domain-containing protein n=1 Tax=Lactiplantibacillus mudanjiangensis TaxID=1296538 RepID=UPI0010152E93|nr:hypothetical protein [Lactobacillus brevis] [Lactiplantibacillus mudanjiangensis]
MVETMQQKDCRYCHEGSGVPLGNDHVVGDYFIQGEAVEENAYIDLTANLLVILDEDYSSVPIVCCPICGRKLVQDSNLHELKIAPQYMAAQLAGTKRFEIRKNDRGYKVGDRLWLREWDDHYTGRTTVVTITYITDYQQKPGYVVLSTKMITGGGSLDGFTD